MRVAALVILYNPDKTLLSNILSYYDYPEKIFIYDNTEAETDIKDLFKDYPKIEYYHDGNNLGIAERLNKGCEKAIAEGFEWILTMDQDSAFLKVSIECYLNCVKNFKEKEKTALFGIAYSREEKIPLDSEWNYVDDLITSGMLLNLALYKKIGPFDANLFIDSVDHDYCIRTKIAGYGIVKFFNIFILHELGEEVYRASIKSLFALKKRKIIHSPVRCYYMLRNILYLEDKFKDREVDLLKLMRISVRLSIKKGLFYGGKTYSMIRHILMARRDFKNKQMGKLKDK